MYLNFLLLTLSNAFHFVAYSFRKHTVFRFFCLVIEGIKSFYNIHANDHLLWVGTSLTSKHEFLLKSHTKYFQKKGSLGCIFAFRSIPLLFLTLPCSDPVTKSPISSCLLVFGKAHYNAHWQNTGVGRRDPGDLGHHILKVAITVVTTLSRSLWLLRFGKISRCPTVPGVWSYLLLLTSGLPPYLLFGFLSLLLHV